jgi:pimeloyl-ACP methyl ester carboxylesterase
MPQRQQVRFVTSADGTRIAVASIGSGAPLVRAAHWLSHVEHDLASPVWRPWLDAVSAQHNDIRCDQRGCGLSDADVREYSLDAWVADLEAVVDGLGLQRFPPIGMSQGGAIAGACAARHPQRVSRLVLIGASARGAHARDLPPGRRRRPRAAA